MLENVLFYIHYSSLLLFGIILSFSYAGIYLTKKSMINAAALFALSGSIQICILAFYDEVYVWEVYPLITHLPIIISLCCFYKTNPLTAIAAVSTAYMCCQPAKWIGVFFHAITNSVAAEYTIRILAVVVIFIIGLKHLSSYLSQIYKKDIRSIIFFSIVPVIYYLFDYSTGIYNQHWGEFTQSVNEFIACLMCVAYLIFCVLYYKEYEQKAEAERKEHIIQITVEEMTKEIDSAKRSEKLIRILRHDMRLLLNNIYVSLENDDTKTAMKMIESYFDQIHSTHLKEYCSIPALNYIFSSFEARCKENDILFSHQIAVSEIHFDEMIFCTLLSNALDNALNAQLKLPKEKRKISIMLKEHNDKILLSVINPFSGKIKFINEIPFTEEKGHGYGTQSIAYLTKKLGGNYQFSTNDSNFILRVII